MLTDKNPLGTGSPCKQNVLIMLIGKKNHFEQAQPASRIILSCSPASKTSWDRLTLQAEPFATQAYSIAEVFDRDVCLHSCSVNLHPAVFWDATNLLVIVGLHEDAYSTVTKIF
jgi:hypothetical protein